MGTSGAMALTRGTGEATTRRTSAVIAAVAVVAMIAASGLSQLLAGASSGGSAAAGALQLSAATPAELHASAQVGAQDSRFWAVRTPAGAITRNPAEHVTAAFTRAGVRVRLSGVQVGLSLIATGRADRLARIAAPVITARANRVSYARGSLTEWYANGPLGLEQGLRLAARPAANGPLTFAYQLTGSGTATLQANTLTFRTSAGTRVLSYSGLSAVDARGRTLPSHLQLLGSRLLIHVRDADATYPITVDPLFARSAQPRAFMSPLLKGAATLLLAASTEPSLSITAENAKGQAWGVGDEGSDTVTARFTITNPPSHGQVTSVVPQTAQISPTGTLTAAAGPTPAIPSGGFSLASGQSTSFTIPYKVTGSGTANLSDSITWLNSPPTSGGGPSFGFVSIPLGSALTGTVKLTADTSRTLPGVPVTVTGTNSVSGNAINKTAITDATGKYKFTLGPGTYKVSPAANMTPTAVGSGDCAASGGTCTVNMSQDRTANFTVACQPTLDFHTSMVATGCFEPKDLAKGLWKAKGQFRMDGIDFKSPDDNAAPVIFDDQNKSVNGDTVQMSLSAPGYGGGWLAFYVPGGLHLGFPTSDTLHTWALSTPWATPGLLSLVNFNFLAAGNGSTTTLFGFPAHAPAIEVDFTPGQTAITAQLSFPPTTSAWLDPINGLWKTSTPDGGSRIAYPTAFKAKMVANNTDGVSTLEGTFSPAGVIGVNTGKYTPPGSPPPYGTVELAKMGLKWELAQGLWHVNGVFVIHSGSQSDKAKAFLEPLGGFLGRTLVAVEVAFRWRTHTVLGHEVPLPSFTGLNVQANGINEYIPDSPFLFWQRAGFNIGIDDKNPLGAYLFGINAGFTWGPRFKHDKLWFQELLSLDIAGSLTFDPFSISGSAELKGLNATLLRGVAKISGAGLYVEGSLGLNLQQILRASFAASIQGTGKIWMPIDGQSHFVMEGLGTGELFRLQGNARFVLTGDAAGVCFVGRASPPWGAYYDSGYHVGGCNTGPFTAAINAGATTSAPSGGDTRGGKDAADIAAAAKTFTLTKRSHVTAVAVRGGGAAPQLQVTGPGGLRLTVTKASPVATGPAAVLVLSPSENRTYILFRRTPKRGTYHLIPRPGSAAIRWVDFSQPLPPVSVKGKLHQVGCRQKLIWKLRRLPRQTVTFVDRGTSSSKTLKTTSASSGSVTFTPQTAAAGAHKIVAMVSQQGTPRAEVVVARYGAPTGTGHVTGLKARRKSGKTTVTWSPVCAAYNYAVTITAGKAKSIKSTKKPTIVIPGKGRRTVTVVAVNTAGQTSKPSSITIH